MTDEITIAREKKAQRIRQAWGDQEMSKKELMSKADVSFETLKRVFAADPRVSDNKIKCVEEALGL
jgi:hypothetical protein